MIKLTRPGRYIDGQLIVRALNLFNGGLDTVDIAQRLGCAEHEAARAVRMGLEAQKARRSEEPPRSEAQA